MAGVPPLPSSNRFQALAAPSVRVSVPTAPPPPKLTPVKKPEAVAAPVPQAAPSVPNPPSFFTRLFVKNPMTAGAGASTLVAVLPAVLLAVTGALPIIGWIFLIGAAIAALAFATFALVGAAQPARPNIPFPETSQSLEVAALLGRLQGEKGEPLHVRITLGTNAGKHGTWPAKYSIAPGTKIELELVVKEDPVSHKSMVDPEASRIRFTKPLKALWLKDTELTLNQYGELRTDLRGFLGGTVDWFAGNLVPKIFGPKVQRLPLELHTLVTTLMNDDFSTDDDILNMSDFAVSADNVAFRGGKLPLPLDGVEVDFKAGTRIDHIEANAAGISIKGTGLQLDRLQIDEGKSRLVGTNLKLDGLFSVSLKNGKPVHGKVEISKVSGTLDDASVFDDGAGTKVKFKSGHIGSGKVSWGGNVGKLIAKAGGPTAGDIEKHLRVTLDDVSGTLDEADFSIAGPQGRVLPLHTRAAAFQGSVSLEPKTGIAVDLSHFDVSASGKAMQIGDPKKNGATFSDPEASLQGSGKFTFNKGVATFAGSADLQASLQVKGRFATAAGLTGLETKSKSDIAIHVTEASFGGEQSQLELQAKASINLASAKLRVADKMNLNLTDTNATLDGHFKITPAAMDFAGDISLKDTVAGGVNTGFINRALAATKLGIKVDSVAASGHAEVSLRGVKASVSSAGAVSATVKEASADKPEAIARVTGHLEDLPSDKDSAVLVPIDRATTVPTPEVHPPSTASLLAFPTSGSVKVIIPAHALAKIYPNFVTQALPGIELDFALDGTRTASGEPRIDRSKVNGHFLPAGSTLLGFTGVKVNPANGHLILAGGTGVPDVDISRLEATFRKVSGIHVPIITMPETMRELHAEISYVSKFISLLVPGPATPLPTAAELDASGITAIVSDAHFDGKELALPPDGAISVDPTSTFSVIYSRDSMVATGHAGIAGHLSGHGLALDNLKGQADILLTASHLSTRPELSAVLTNISGSADRLALDDPSTHDHVELDKVNFSGANIVLHTALGRPEDLLDPSALYAGTTMNSSFASLSGNVGVPSTITALVNGHSLQCGIAAQTEGQPVTFSGGGDHPALTTNGKSFSLAGNVHNFRATVPDVDVAKVIAGLRFGNLVQAGTTPIHPELDVDGSVSIIAGGASTFDGKVTFDAGVKNLELASSDGSFTLSAEVDHAKMQASHVVFGPGEHGSTVVGHASGSLGLKIKKLHIADARFGALDVVPGSAKLTVSVDRQANDKWGTVDMSLVLIATSKSLLPRGVLAEGVRLESTGDSEHVRITIPKFHMTPDGQYTFTVYAQGGVDAHGNKLILRSPSSPRPKTQPHLAARP